MKIRTKIAHALFPSYVWESIFGELRLTKIRWGNHLSPSHRTHLRSYRQMRGMKLQLGCGTRVFDGWVNVDAAPGVGVDLYLDLRQPLPFGNSSAVMIYSEHVIEHLNEAEVTGLLRECHRVLIPNGTIRLGVPDAELYLRSYAADRQDFFNPLRHLGGATIALVTPLQVINQMFRMGGHHRSAWDFQLLSMFLTDCGFANVRKWDPGQSSRSELCLDDPGRAFETLYVEATKPFNSSERT